MASLRLPVPTYQQGLLAPGVSETLHGIDQHVYDQLRVVKQQFPFGRAANRELVTDVARQDLPANPSNHQGADLIGDRQPKPLLPISLRNGG